MAELTAQKDIIEVQYKEKYEQSAAKQAKDLEDALAKEDKVKGSLQVEVKNHKETQSKLNELQNTVTEKVKIIASKDLKISGLEDDLQQRQAVMDS